MPATTQIAPDSLCELRLPIATIHVHMSDASSRKSSLSAIDPREALSGSLDQLGALLGALTPDQYSSRSVAGFDSSIGAHVRHCLDHARSLLDASCRGASSPVVYDRRTRGTEVETDLDAGRRETLHIARSIHALAGELSDAIEIRALVAPEGGEQVFQSTLGRELLYVFHHTVHHLAIVCAQTRSLGLEVASEFGRAPATVAADRAASDS